MGASEALYAAASQAFTQALGATGEHVVEINKQDAIEFRLSLQALTRKLEEAPGPDEYARAREAFVERIRLYQEKAHQDLQLLHREMDSAAKAVEVFVDGMSAGGLEHRNILEQEFDRVEVAVSSGDMDRIRSVVHHAVQSVKESYDHLKETHTMVVAQMRDEIRTLQAAVEVSRKGLAGEVGGVWEKGKLTARLDDFLHRNRQFSVVVVGIGDVATLLTRHARPLIDHVLKESLTNLADLVCQKGVTGIWEDGVFVAILEGPPAPALELALQAEQNLSGRYILRLNGAARTIRVEAVGRTADHVPGAPIGNFLAALDAGIRDVSGAK